MKTFYVGLCLWPNGTYGLPVKQELAAISQLSALSIWRVRTSSSGFVVPLLVAFLAGQDVDVVLVR